MSRILKEGQSKDKQNINVLKSSVFPIVFLAIFFLAHCRPSPVILLPLPSKVERIEGYASLRITGDQGSSRSKFSFLFQLPHQGRLEVSNILGRTLYQIIVAEEKAAFIVPSKRIYWQGEEEEIIRYFLGFRLNLYEMINLLSGRWEGEEMEYEGEEDKEIWSFAKDESDRIMAGQRGEFRFEVKEFFADTPFARVLVFQHPLNNGRLKVLRISLNQPLKKGAFSLSVLGRYERKSWAEIEKILADEN
jgi:outer membrane biogenesis lipoprotein LolB